MARNATSGSPGTDATLIIGLAPAPCRGDRTSGGGTTAEAMAGALASGLYLAAPRGSCRGEIAVDARASQLAGLVAAFGDCNEGRPWAGDRRADGRADGNGEPRGAIKRRTRERNVFYPGRLAGETGLGYDTVMGAALSLERGGGGTPRAVGDEQPACRMRHRGLLG